MKSFLREVIAAMKEGPGLFFAPVRAAVKVAEQGTLQGQPARHHTTPTALR